VLRAPSSAAIPAPPPRSRCRRSSGAPTGRAGWNRPSVWAELRRDVPAARHGGLLQVQGPHLPPPPTFVGCAQGPPRRLTPTAHSAPRASAPRRLVAPQPPRRLAAGPEPRPGLTRREDEPSARPRSPRPPASPPGSPRRGPPAARGSSRPRSGSRATSAGPADTSAQARGRSQTCRSTSRQTAAAIAPRSRPEASAVHRPSRTRSSAVTRSAATSPAASTTGSPMAQAAAATRRDAGNTAMRAPIIANRSRVSASGSPMLP
jgi:hypothetical protein